MKKGEIYKCSYTSGGGTEYDEGEWIIKILTDKTLLVEKITDIGDNYEKGEKIRCGRKTPTRNPLRDWEDGSFTIYPNQSGTPYYFKSTPKKQPVYNLTDQLLTKGLDDNKMITEIRI